MVLPWAGDCDIYTKTLNNKITWFYLMTSFLNPFDESVESVIINRNGVITYLDTLNYKLSKWMKPK